MLKGIFLIQWDPKRGPFVKVQYPPDLGVDRNQDLVIKVYGTCVYAERVEGYHKAVFGKYEIPAYYSGMELNLILASLVEGESGDVYRESLLTIAPIMFKRRGVILSDAKWEELFKIMEAFPKMTSDEKIAYALSDPIRVKIIEIVTKRVGLPLDDIRKALVPSVPDITRAEVMSHVDLLERLGILVKFWPPEEAEPHVTLARDIVFTRTAHEKALKVIEEKPEYVKFISEFYAKYNWEKDQSEVAAVIARPETKILLNKVFKGSPVVPLSKIPKDALPARFEKDLINKNVIRKSKDEVFLITVPKVRKIFPEHHIAKMLKMVEEGKLSRDEAIAYLKAMRLAYLM